MSSAVKPQPAATPQSAGQPSPAKAFTSPQNSHPALVGQNLTQSVNQAALNAAHPPPIMSPVTQNMAQMAQNMSHHGNLSQTTQNSPVGVTAPSGKPSAPTNAAPLSLVQEKPSQPLALTRTPEKKGDAPLQANGTVDAPKLQHQNEKTPTKPSVSPQKPIEKPEDKPSPAKVEACKPESAKVETPKLVEKKVESPAKPAVPAAQQEKQAEVSKPEQQQVKEAPTKEPATPVKEAAVPTDNENKPVKPKQAAIGTPKETKESEVKNIVAESAVPPKGVSPHKESKPETPVPAAKAPRKRKQQEPAKASDGLTPAKKQAEPSTPASARSKRNRMQVQPYQSPTPELAMVTKLSATHDRATPTKSNDDKLTVFYKNEYLAVRNAEGGFYVCQAMQNVYRSTKKIKIRWLSQDKTLDPSGETYKPDFYDTTDMECVLTTLSLKRGPAGTQILKGNESARAGSILQRALQAERGDAPQLSETHPDGLDLSLYKDESQLDVVRTPKKRSAPTSPTEEKDPLEEDDSPPATKRAKKAKKKAAKKAKKAEKAKGKSAAPAPSPVKTKTVAAAKAAEAANKSRATTAPLSASKPDTNNKKKASPKKDDKAKIVQPTPSTSTGKATRSPRKPPAKK